MCQEMKQSSETQQVRRCMVLLLLRGLQVNEEKVTVQNKSFRAQRWETALGAVLHTPDEIQGA